MENKNNTIETTATAKANGKDLASILHTLHVACHFIPLISTPAIALVLWCNLPDLLCNLVLVPLAVIGWIAALFTGPVKFFKTVLTFITGGWSVGFTLCPFFPLCFATGLLGAAVGFTISAFAVLFAPAVFTIYSYLTKYVF